MFPQVSEQFTQTKLLSSTVSAQANCQQQKAMQRAHLINLNIANIIVTARLLFALLKRDSL